MPQLGNQESKSRMMLTFGVVGLFSSPSFQPFDWIFLLLSVSSLLVEGVAFERGSAFFGSELLDASSAAAVFSTCVFFRIALWK
jgi:hypothetical protein